MADGNHCGDYYILPRKARLEEVIAELEGMRGTYSPIDHPAPGNEIPPTDSEEGRYLALVLQKMRLSDEIYRAENPQAAKRWDEETKQISEKLKENISEVCVTGEDGQTRTLGTCFSNTDKPKALWQCVLSVATILSLFRTNYTSYRTQVNCGDREAIPIVEDTYRQLKKS